MPAKAYLPVPKPSASRLRSKMANKKEDAKRLSAWRQVVYLRDEGKCRCCGCATIKLRVGILFAQRAECHHVEPRVNRATRYETRNGLLLCYSCHSRVTGKVNNKHHIKGTAWFFGTDGRRYVNCNHKVYFEEMA